MSAHVIILPEFERRNKRLSRKFRKLPNEVDSLIDQLEAMPRQGKSLGAGFYKIRLASASKGGGKSSGFRVITYYVAQMPESEVVYLVAIYDKSEEGSISKEELLNIMKRELEREDK